MGNSDGSSEVSGEPRVILTHRAAITAPEPGWTPIAWSVGPRADALLLFVRKSDHALATGRDPRGFPLSRLPYPLEALVVRHDGIGNAETRRLRGLAVGFPFVQPFADGSIVVCGSRCARFANGEVERNAQVFAPDGALARELTLGDGIAHLQVSDDDKLWVGYTDEGIFGNYGWGVGEGPGPIGAPGLVRFSRAGAMEWERPETPEWPPVAHCYALNVSAEAIWEYMYDMYDRFPLVRIPTTDPAIAPSVWDTGVAGASAIVVSENRALFFGGYRSERYRCVKGVLGASAVMDLRPVALMIAPQTPLDERRDFHQAIGRGAQLHIFAGDSWYTLDLSTQDPV